ncbi:MAG: metallophosphoesterase [Planctomycetes bacterium]|nr:metallophosphoesterase [Planctomycetota bacterium]
MAANEAIRIIVFGDHRRPLWFDPRSRNESARRRIFEAAAAARPDLILDTGDLVPHAFESSWRAFDRDAAIIYNNKSAFEAVPGNHETYGLFPRAAKPEMRMRRFLERFPRSTNKRWGARDIQYIRILLLDSNANALTAAEIDEQERFIEGAVAAADADPKITLVIAAWHHAPFTNSTAYGDDRFSGRSFLPRLRQSRKLGAIFCGHVHAYERFWFDSVSVIITGGGGAHAHRFPADHKYWRHTPAFDASAMSHLHFVELQCSDGVARATVRHLDSGVGVPHWTVGDAFEIRPRMPDSRQSSII